MRNMLKHALILSILVTTSIISGERERTVSSLNSQPEITNPGAYTSAEDFSPSYDFRNSAGERSNITFMLRKPGYVNIRIYDAAGKTVDELLTSTFGAGSHEIVWDPSKFPSGKYYYSLITSEYSITKQLN